MGHRSSRRPIRIAPKSGVIDAGGLISDRPIPGCHIPGGLIPGWIIPGWIICRGLGLLQRRYLGDPAGMRVLRIARKGIAREGKRNREHRQDR
jgi:hypothetical protein